MIDFSLRNIYSIHYFTRFLETSPCFLLSSLMGTKKILLESVLFPICSYSSQFMSELCIDKLVDAFMRDVRDVHRFIIWMKELETSCNNIWTPTETQMFYDISEYLWSFQRSSPVYFFPSFFALYLCCIWQIVVVFGLLLSQSVVVVR